MTSKRHWETALAARLTPSEQAGTPPRVAIVGVGHELSGDDVAGVLVARALMPPAEASERVLVIDAGPAPENVTGALRRFAPDSILFVDAARMDEAPGTICWLDWQDITGVSASTHTLPLNMVAAYLRSELGADVALLGIQPGDMSPGGAVTPPVEQAISDVVETLTDLLGLAAPS